MKLSEMVETEIEHPICDPCRMLGPHKREIGRESFGHGSTSRHVVLVQDDETGLITRQYMYGDGHLEWAGEDN